MSLAIGDSAPEFSLRNANMNIGPSTMSFEEVKKENGTVVVFECNHCPYVVASVERMNAMSKHCASNGIGFAGINSNDPVMYQNDSYEHMVKRAEEMPYAYLHDDSQDIAHAYGAERTPEFFLFDANDILVYRGRMDDNPKNPNETTTSELHDAITSMLKGETPSIQVTTSIGCSVKWKA